MINILFICHGNICRSPMAEMVLKDMVRKAGLAGRFSITSRAATTEEIGEDMYPPARRTLDAHHIPHPKRKASLITEEDYKKADYIIAMDQENLHDLAYLTHHDPDHKISLLLSWAGEGRDVADPWFTKDYEKTYDDVVKGCKGILGKLGKHW
ncbi:low molecular weight protein-tyrosine-phosphatase [uncultured Dialister sp.]|jgi:protein-tyrosine phosphatase|uniref:low molecular weight protein-tyrosine-phosphatase n=1 Tax=uncultured Dialister sp. TaxID=278064 RepID=UPI0025EE012E|nr:low molecular weight protein-tyrosine-phosphatase [uncultured Dialister sp.]